MKALAQIDWSAPWFSAVAPLGSALASAADLHDALNEAAARLRTRNERGRQLRFVDGSAAGAVPYESHIASTGEVPTRTNCHDALNALIWLALPQAKARLNALQANAIAAAGVGARRGALRDATTLIDENGALLLTRRAELVEALRQRDWQTLFVDHRSAWHDEVRVVVFGHALMEKLITPYKGITAHALPLALEPTTPVAAVDAAVAHALDRTLTTQRLLPLPLLGIPGWAANADPAFYADARVFRPRRDSPSALAAGAA